MFQRVKESIKDYAATTNNSSSSQPKRFTRRRLKASFIAPRRAQRVQRVQRPPEEEEEISVQDNDDDDSDNRSVRSTITVETTRTATNENRKPTLGDASSQNPTQVFVEANPVAAGDPTYDPYDDPVEVLERAQSDITKLSIYVKEIPITRQVAAASLALLRGDNRSWEAIAVDILRQKARWESITVEDCEGEYLDTLLGVLISVDDCVVCHLSNLILTPHAAWTFQSLQFCKSMTKLQLDLIDLSFAMPLLCKGLKNNMSLDCLIASRCGLNDDRLHELFSNLPKQLGELRIFGNRCRQKGLVAITAVVFHSQHLKILDLSYQHVDPNAKKESDLFDVSWLAGALHHNRTLKVLDLDNDSIDDGHLTHLCAALCANDTLEEVMLNHNRITATGVALLSQKFGQMKGLKKISMYSNLFDAPQVDAMVGQNKQPTPREIDTAAAASSGATLEGGQEEEVTSDLEDDDDDDDDEFDYEEEIIGEVNDDDDEEEVMEEDSTEGDFMDDDSSTAPPSADFREPEDITDDSIPDDEGEDGNNSSSKPAPTNRAAAFMPAYWGQSDANKEEAVEKDSSQAINVDKDTVVAEEEDANEISSSAVDDDENDKDTQEQNGDNDLSWPLPPTTETTTKPALQEENDVNNTDDSSPDIVEENGAVDLDTPVEPPKKEEEEDATPSSNNNDSPSETATTPNLPLDEVVAASENESPPLENPGVQNDMDESSPPEGEEGAVSATPVASTDDSAPDSSTDPPLSQEVSTPEESSLPQTTPPTTTDETLENPGVENDMDESSPPGEEGAISAPPVASNDSAPDSTDPLSQEESAQAVSPPPEDMLPKTPPPTSETETVLPPLHTEEELKALHDRHAQDELKHLRELVARGEDIDADRLEELELFDRHHKGEELDQDELEELEFFQEQRDLYVRFEMELEQLKRQRETGDNVAPIDIKRFRLLELAQKKHAGEELSAEELDELVEFIVEEEGDEDDDSSDDEDEE